VRHAVERDDVRRFRGSVLVAVALLLAAGLIARTSLAAFTASTTNPGDHWATGTVALADDDTGSARFNVSGMVPGGAGATDTKCIRVSYTGSATANIRMYVLPANLTGTGLGPYLTFTVEEGSGGTFADCTGFVANATTYGPGTLAAFAAAYPSFASGFSAWQSAGAGNRTYRITYTLQNDNGAQGKSVDAVFTWEAQSA
jgi:hypothetical protein